MGFITVILSLAFFIECVCVRAGKNLGEAPLSGEEKRCLMQDLPKSGIIVILLWQFHTRRIRTKTEKRRSHSNFRLGAPQARIMSSDRLPPFFSRGLTNTFFLLLNLHYCLASFNKMGTFYFIHLINNVVLLRLIYFFSFILSEHRVQGIEGLKSTAGGDTFRSPVANTINIYINS